MKLFLIVLVCSRLLKTAVSQNNDLFNFYVGDVGNECLDNDTQCKRPSFAQDFWAYLRCGNAKLCKGFPDKFATTLNDPSYGWSIGDKGNNCKWCPDNTDSQQCGSHRQSPINLERYPAVQTDPRAMNCTDSNPMQYKDGTCSFDNMKSQFKIERHALQLHTPTLADGTLNCFKQGVGNLFPRIPDGQGSWFLARTDITTPSQHHQEGYEYAAEITLAHFYSVRSSVNQIGHVTIFLQDYPNEQSWPFLDKLICQWREQEERVRSKCNLPPAPIYGNCRLFRGQTRTNAPTQNPSTKPVSAQPNEPIEPNDNLMSMPSMGPTSSPVETLIGTGVDDKNHTVEPNSPSNAPTAKPTLATTAKPAVIPTATLTATLSPKPSTRQPSSETTKKPSTEPNTTLLAKPTITPTEKPTSIETAEPTITPTATPTMTLSPNPTTTEPSSGTTRKPSTEPNKTLLAQPTSTPTEKTAKPTVRLSPKPIIAPTAEPTITPTATPTTTLSPNPVTREPSSETTKTSSKGPTTKPAANPSEKASAKPSTKPSSKPNRKPSATPTRKPQRAPVFATTPVVDVDCARQCPGGSCRRMCDGTSPCCQSTRTDTGYCWDVYENFFPGEQIFSACSSCCNQTDLKRNEFFAQPKVELSKTIKCSAYYTEVQRFCKPGGCCSNPRSTSMFCQMQYQIIPYQKFQEICYYCCNPSVDLPARKQRSLGLNHNGSGSAELTHSEPKPGLGVNNLKREFEDESEGDRLNENKFEESAEGFETHHGGPGHDASTSSESDGADASDVVYLDGRKFKLSAQDHEKLRENSDEVLYRAYLERQRMMQEGDFAHAENYEDVAYMAYEWMLKVQTEYYFRYNGTQVVPPCREVVNWRVMKDPIRVHQRQIRELQRLLAWRIEPNNCKAETAGVSISDDQVDASRAIQFTNANHGMVFCECQNWPSKFANDQAWCDNYKSDTNYDRFYKFPYGFSG